MSPERPDPGGDTGRARERFLREVEAKGDRRARARRRRDRPAWFGLGMFGLMGWSVAVPTLLGIALGAWIDRRHPEPPSWTLMLLFAGVVVGCLNAWYWMEKERRETDAEGRDEEEP